VRRKTSDLDGSPPSNRLRLTILAATAAAFLLVPVAQAAAFGTMHVHLAGTGTGTVSSIGGFQGTGLIEGSPPIECSGPPATGVCETELVEFGEESYLIALHQTAAPGSTFTGWTIEEGIGGCEENPEPGEGQYCPSGSFEEEGDASVTAHFTAAAPPGPELTVTKEGTGSGTVASNPGGILCGSECSSSFEEGKVVTLTASPSAGSQFVSWKGCDKGGANGRECKVTMSVAKKVSAKFVKSYGVTVSRAGSGLGKVSSSPGGVLCLTNCSSTTAEFKEGTTVKLSAAPSKHFHLVKWTGACSGSGSCELAPNESHTVGFEFSEDAQFALSVAKEGGGNGTVKSNVAGISCGATCGSMSANYYGGTEVTLTATPGKGSALEEWTGACSGSGTCTVTMSAAKSVGAKFE
jgi:Divergent InlB B-repeat domain